ncbi:MAG: hypothetical protein AB3N11_10995, partial [Arenibacterium sp.]
MSSESIDQVLNSAVAAQDVPFVVAMSANSAGVTYSGAAGQACGGGAAAEDTVFWVFSATQALGSLGGVIMIYRGKMTVGTPGAGVFAAWNKIQVLDRWGGGKPIPRASQNTAP